MNFQWKNRKRILDSGQTHSSVLFSPSWRRTREKKSATERRAQRGERVKTDFTYRCECSSALVERQRRRRRRAKGRGRRRRRKSLFLIIASNPGERQANEDIGQHFLLRRNIGLVEQHFVPCRRRTKPSLKLPIPFEFSFRSFTRSSARSP